MVWLLTAALAAASEAPEPPMEEEAPLRHTNPGVGLGFAQLGQRLGLHVEARSESPLSRSFQFNLTLAGGFTRPQNTAAMFDWGLRHGAWTTQAFGDITAWAGTGSEETEPFRWMGAFFGYFFAGLSYVAVPVAWILSPFASLGHVIVGPTVSWHSRSDAPNGYVEVGVGGSLYGHPEVGTVQAGIGPIVGAGAQAGKQTVGVRVLILPPGSHSNDVAPRETVISGSLGVVF